MGLALGLSPRGRGNPGADPNSIYLYRSIPAWAGEPVLTPTRCHLPGVYPRVGGGTSASNSAWSCCTGLSPRGRGNQSGVAVSLITDRSIPAWAGEPLSPACEVPEEAVYPRVGGGTSIGRSKTLSLSGLSPRGRGNLPDAVVSTTFDGSIPAWAGEPCRVRDRPLFSQVYPRVGGEPDGYSSVRRHRRVYPRVGGGTTFNINLVAGGGGLSPRGRGNHRRHLALGMDTGSIPAWAGEPRRTALTTTSCGVYPRVGGGTHLHA